MHIIDIKALTEMFFGNKEKVNLVIEALIQRIPEWQIETKHCADGNDTTAIRELCHRIRGAAGSIKAEKLSAAAASLGDIIKDEKFDKVPAGFAKLNHCLEEIRQETLLPPQ